MALYHRPTGRRRTVPFLDAAHESELALPRRSLFALGVLIMALAACSARVDRSEPSAEGAAAIDVCDTFERDYVRCMGALGPAAQAAVQSDVRTLRASVASMIAEGETGRAKAKEICSQRAAQMRTACR